MGKDPGTDSTTVNEIADTEQIRAEIDSTREELGDTVAALSAKTDVKAQAKQRLEDTKSSLAGKKDELLGKARDASPESASEVASRASEQARQNPLPLAAFGAFAFGFLVGRTSRR